MSAMPPVSALPTLPAPAAAAPTAPAGSAGAGPAPATENNGGFADALQQARQGAARTRENNQRAAQKEGGKERAAAPREPGRSEAAPETVPADDANPAATGKTRGPGAEADTSTESGLPPWLAQALTRTPATADLPNAGDLARAAQASLAGTNKTGTESQEPDQATATPAPATLGSPAIGGFSLPAAGEAGAVERPIAAPVSSPAFAPALGAELTLMVKEGVSEARLHLNPAEMGPITVQIVVEGQTARVEMTADNAATRQVLEQAMPALAGALREDGLTLTGGGVFEQARQPRQGGDEQAANRPGAAGASQTSAEGGNADPAAPRSVPLAQGRVDLYA